MTPEDVVKLYTRYRGMIERCTLKAQKFYPDYGGRGIKVCDRWMKSFNAFVEDVGPMPFPGAQLDRKDVNGHYEPGNVRWVSQKANAANKRNTRLLTHDGVTMTLADWARHLGMSSGALCWRFKLGWGVEKALTTPRPSRPNSKLSVKEAREIRALYPEESMEKIAERYGVSKKTVLQVVHRRVFADV